MRAPLERRCTTWPESVAPRSWCQAGDPYSWGRKLGLVLSCFPLSIHRSYQEYTRRRSREQQGYLEGWRRGTSRSLTHWEDPDTYDFRVLSSDNSANCGTSNRTSLPVIVINSEDWAERKRFNVAHELGHLVMDVAPGLDCEKAAHRFAAAFLMPAESLWNEVGMHRTSVSMAELLQLKNLFGTSFQAITYRCKDLGIIGEQLFKSLFEIFKDRGWRAPPFKEPGAIPPEKEKPQRFERLCYRAVAEGALSEAKTAELLGISVRRLNDRLDHPETAASFA